MENLTKTLVALQLDHPDATFYSVGLGENTVSGLFAAHDQDQPFEVGFDQFLQSCYTCGIIADYADGCIYIPGDRTDRNARQWAADWLRENHGTKEFGKALSDAVWVEFAHELAGLLGEIQRVTPATIIGRMDRSRDTAFCDAVTELARIIEANASYLAEVEKANA